MLLHASELGQGKPIALLHGLFGRSQNLATLARRLAEEFRVISIDLRNHGASPHAPGMSYHQMAADVLETLAARDALPAALLGHSMGGKAAMVCALTEPDAVSSLVVADIAPIAYRHSNHAVAQALLDLQLKPGLTRGEADRALADPIPDAAVRGFLLQNLAIGTAPAWRIGLQNITDGMADIEGFPPFADMRYAGATLFIRGALSNYVKDEARIVIAALFPTSTTTTIANAGHWLHADQPEAFGASVQNFLHESGTRHRF